MKYGYDVSKIGSMWYVISNGHQRACFATKKEAMAYARRLIAGESNR